MERSIGGRRAHRFGDAPDVCPTGGIEGEVSDIMGLDMRVLEYARNVGWESMSTNFKVGKGMIDMHADKVHWRTSHSAALEFLGAYRKVIIDYILTYNISRLSASPSAQAAYAAFLGPKNNNNKQLAIKDLVSFSASGSTNATSDYDVTLCGPGLHCLLSRVISVFSGVVSEAHKRAGGGSKPALDRDHDQNTTALIMDANFYTGPEILVKKGDVRMNGVTFFYPHGETKEYNVAVPVPTTDDVIAAERASILKKIQSSPKSIVRAYKDLVAVTKELDAMLYRTQQAVDAAALFNLLFRLKETSVEAYHGVSTVLVVVHGMQSNQRGEVYGKLGAEGYRNAGLENVIDFAAHWNAYAIKNERTAETDKLALIHLSKYLVRVLVCIDALNSKLRPTERAYSVAEPLASQINKLYAGRATGKAECEIDFEAYGITRAPRAPIKLGEPGGKGLVHEAFAYLKGPGKQKASSAFGCPVVSPTFFA